MIENRKSLHYIDTWKDIIKEEPPSFEETLRKYKNGQISIGVHRSTARFIYITLSNNPLVALFHFIISIYSFPLTIIGAIIIPILVRHYFYILLFFIGLFILLAVEDRLLRIITINSALRKEELFQKLYKKGIIKILNNT